VAGGAASGLEFLEPYVGLLNSQEKPHLAVVSRRGGRVGGFGAPSGGRFVSGPDPQIEGLTRSTGKIERIPGPRDQLKPFHASFQFMLAGVDEKGQEFSVEEPSEFFTIELDIDAIYSPKGIIAIDIDECVLGIRGGEWLERRSRWRSGSTCRVQNAQNDQSEKGRNSLVAHDFSWMGGSF